MLCIALPVKADHRSLTLPAVSAAAGVALGDWAHTEPITGAAAWFNALRGRVAMLDAFLIDAQANGANGTAMADGAAAFPTIEDYIGETPLVRLQRLPGRVARLRNNVILAKLEGNNPAGSVKDRCHLVNLCQVLCPSCLCQNAILLEF